MSYYWGHKAIAIKIDHLWNEYLHRWLDYNLYLLVDFIWQRPIKTHVIRPMKAFKLHFEKNSDVTFTLYLELIILDTVSSFRYFDLRYSSLNRCIIWSKNIFNGRHFVTVASRLSGWQDRIGTYRRRYCSS